MANISFNFSNCTHIYFKDSSCKLCLDICPIENTVISEDYKIIFNPENCVSCGGCSNVCPTGAFNLNSYSISELINKKLSSNEDFISCKRDLPCLIALNPQDLITLVLKLEKDITLDIGHCKECFIGKLKDKILEIVNEANYFLKSLGIENIIKVEELNIPEKKEDKNKRRDFLKRFGKLGAGLVFWATVPNIVKDEEEKEVKQKNIVEEKVLPDKRINLLNTLKEKELDLENRYIEVDRISFTSDKWIDFQKCTNCSVCYKVCPTGALKGVDGGLKIQFEPSLCVKCRVCHEVCPEDCLYLEDRLNLKDFVYGKKILAEHIMIQCEECLIPFSYKGDTTICPRCRELEDEIRDLLQIGE